MELLREPRPESISAKHQELTIIGPDKNSRQTTREVIRKSTIIQESLYPTFHSLWLKIRFKQANFFERRNRPMKRLRQPAQDCQIISRVRRGDSGVGPLLSQNAIDLAHDRVCFSRHSPATFGPLSRYVCPRGSSDQHKNPQYHTQWQDSSSDGVGQPRHARSS